MLILAILFTLVLTAAFAVVPARLGRRKPTRADGCCALLPAVLVWLWAACIWSKPGLTIGFDAFRCLGITAMVLWACGLAAGFRHASVRKWTAAALLLAASLGAEVFIGNLNFWATHSYEPVDLRAYLQEAEDDHNALTLDDEHTTLTFTGLDRELYNLQLSGLEYVYNGPHPEVQNPLFILNVAATDEATSASRQSWNWEVAANAPRSQVRSLDLSGKASILTLTAYPYNGEYRQYPISYTLQTIYANVPRAFDFSLVRWAAVLALLSAAYALRPVSAAWRDAYLTHRKKYRPVVLLVAVILGAAAFFAPFADRFNAGVSTSFYNTADWDGGSRINFTLHIDDWASDAAAQYGALAHSLLNGRLDLMQDPPEELLALDNPYDSTAREAAQVNSLWDHAYYNGRYYVYFGIVPCLLFQLPFEAVTGIQNLAYPPCMIVMGLLFLLASFGAVHQVVRRWFSQASSAAYLLSVAAIVLGSQLYYLFVRPYIYEYAIVCGTSLLMLALWFWLSAANTAVEHRGALLAKLALGSLCMALVAGCRPQMELFAVLALPIFWQRYIAQKRLRSRAGAGEAAAFLLPVVLVAAGLMWYNYARFGSPFDFGANYNLTGNDMTKRGFNVVRIGPAVFTSLFDLPRLKSVFPFLQETEVTTNAVIRTISEPFVGGMLAATPFTWVLGLLALPQTRQSLRRRPGAAGFVWLAVAGMVIITVVDCEMAGVLYRYLMDYSPVLLLGAVLCWLLLESVLARRAAAGETLAVTLLPVLRVAMAAAVAWSAVYRFFTLFATQPWLQGLNPSLYFNVARLVQFWM